MRQALEGRKARAEHRPKVSPEAPACRKAGDARRKMKLYGFEFFKFFSECVIVFSSGMNVPFLNFLQEGKRSIDSCLRLLF